MVQVMEMTAVDRELVERLARSTSAPHGKVVQAKALLQLADGASVRSTAALLGTYPNTVSRWRDRFVAEGGPGIGMIREGRGRKPEIRPVTIDAIVRDTLHSVPDDGSMCWSTRSLGAKHGVGKDAVARIWKAMNLRPWPVETFRISTDPDFKSKLVDVVGLYLKPPQRAVVFCVNDKTPWQPLDRTQPSLLLKPGRAPSLTQDDKRHGTIDLMAAMNISPGEVLDDMRNGQAGSEVLAFFKLIDLRVERHLDVHVVLDNLSAHKSEPIRAWLAHPHLKRWHLHFTPTSASWLNLIEDWFAALTRGAHHDTSFGSVAELTDAADMWASHWNDDPQPFVWTKTADTIVTAADHITQSATMPPAQDSWTPWPRSKSSAALTRDLEVTYSFSVANDDELHSVFNALADPTRRFLLDLLYERDGRTLTDMESGLSMTRFGVMKHLKVLEEAGLVIARRSGREKLHYLNPVPIRHIHDRWIDKYTERRVSALLDLKDQLEERS